MGKVKQLVFETTFSTYYGISQIGRGGAGVVVKVQDENKEIFAIKYLSPLNLSTDKIKRFRNELSFCSTNEHKNVVRVIDHGWIYIQENKCPFYVMPYYEGTLRKLLKSGISSVKALPYFSQILDGVEAAHLKGVCHRDLKPENVLFDQITDTLVVADFGIARFAEPLLQTAVQTKDSDRLANFQFAAPEQRERDAKVDHRADIYALGLMLNEMFTGKVAQGVGFKHIAEVSPEQSYLDEITDLMLNQNPDQRSNSIGEIKRQLIGRKNDFIEEQKLSEFKNKVIPKADVDDPLIENPPEIVDVKWDNGSLIFTLSQPVNSVWAGWFISPGGYTGIRGCGPKAFHISGTTATVPCPGNWTQEVINEVINYAKGYVKAANNRYKEVVERTAHENKAKEEAELKRQIELAERTKAINESLKF